MGTPEKNIWYAVVLLIQLDRVAMIWFGSLRTTLKPIGRFRCLKKLTEKPEYLIATTTSGLSSSRITLGLFSP